MDIETKTATRMNQQWLIEHQSLSEFRGKWVLLQNGKLLCMRNFLKEIFVEHPNLLKYKDAMVTIV